jgi:Undecaprenyl-phosphate glucose phosphotransferase
MAEPAEPIHLHPGKRSPRLDSGATFRPRTVSPEVISGASKLVDFCLVLAAGAASFAFYLVAVVNDPDGLNRYALSTLLAATLFVIGFQRAGGYRFKMLSNLRWQSTRIALIWGGAVSALLLLAFLTKISDTYSRGWVLSWTAMSLGLLLLHRSALFLAIGRWMRQGRLVRRVVIVGAGEPGEQLLGKLQRSRDESIAILGIFDDRKTRVAPAIGDFEVLGTTDDLLMFARRVPIDEVIVALPLNAEQRLRMLFAKLRRLPTDLRLSVEPIAEAFPVRGVSHIGDVPMLEIVDRPLKHWSAVAKWIEDTILGTLLLILLAPAMALIALLIKLDSRGPVFFAQERFGFNNQVIRVLKFRTMYVDCGDPTGAQRTVRNDPRVTRIGRFLRAFSLDELPQLLNVVRGEMSLVGPRPHAITMRAGDRLYHDAIEDYLNRHRVKPGITGWAQVNGLRGEIDTLDKARQRVTYDLDYIEGWSLWLDLKILLLSFRMLVTRENAY